MPVPTTARLFGRAGHSKTSPLTFTRSRSSASKGGGIQGRLPVAITTAFASTRV